MKAVTLLLTDASGIYIPQRFVTECLFPSYGEITGNAAQWALDECKAGPDSEDYWEAWDEVLNRFVYTLDGQQYRLHQDGDLWLICIERMTAEEMNNFGFE